MLVTYATEAWPDVLPELQSHWFAHWQEVGVYRDKIVLDPNYAEYERAHNTGQLHVTAVRDAGKLVGYLTAIVRPHLHYSHSLTAYFDLYYVAPSHRRGMVGVKLFSEAERALKARGVDRMITGTKLSKDASKIFERQGWDETERTFMKYIGD